MGLMEGDPKPAINMMDVTLNNNGGLTQVTDMLGISSTKDESEVK
jgi:hypothetical protein